MSSSKKPSGAKLLTEKTSTEQFKYVAAILEQVQEQVKGVAESLDMTRTELGQRIEDVRTELKQDIAMTQMALKAVKNDHDARFDQMDNRFEKMDNRFDQMDSRFEKMDNRFDQMDKRFDRMEEKFDRVAEKVEHHDEAIVFLKAAVAK